MLAVFRPSAVAAAAPEADVPLPAAALLLAGALLGALLDELLDELHAASAARPAAAGTTSSARLRRLGTFSLPWDVIMYFLRFSLVIRLSPCAAASSVSCGNDAESPPCSRRYGRR